MDNLFLLYGSNKDLMEEEKNKIIEESGVDEFNLSLFDMEEVSYKDAIDDGYNVPFISDVRVVVIKNCYFFSTQKVTKPIDSSFDELLSYFDNSPSSTITIFMCPYNTLDGKKSLVKELKEKAKLIECLPYTKEYIVRFIDDTLKDANITLKGDARNELIDRLQDDPYNFKNEIDKLILFAKDVDNITLNDIERIILKDPNENAYELLNAISSSNKKEALNVYYNLLKTGKDPLYLLAMIVSKFEEILYSKELLKQGFSQEEFMDALNVSKGRAYYMIKQAKDMPYSVVRSWLRRCVSLDYQIKSGQITSDAGVELLLLKM